MSQADIGSRASGEARPYILLGGQRLAAICERVRQALDAVAREWCREPHALQLIAVSQIENAAPGLRNSRLRYLVRDGEAWLGYIAPELACVTLAEGWLGFGISTPGPLIETLEREFLQELFSRLRGTSSPAVILADSSELPDRALHAGAGTAIVEIDIDGVPLTLVIPAQVWTDLLDAPVAQGTRTLIQAASAITASRVRIEARLPAVQMPLSEVTGLTPGDFVDLQLDLTGVVRIVSRDTDLGLEAVLGKRGGHRAIQLNTNTGTTK